MFRERVICTQMYTVFCCSVWLYEHIQYVHTHICTQIYISYIYILFTQYFYLHIFIFILKCIYIVYLYAHIYIYRYGCACVCDYYFLLFFGMVLASPALLEQRSQEM